MGKRATILADRVEQGAEALITLVENCTKEEWQMLVPAEGRSVGVLVHHIASMYPAEINIVKLLASGQAVQGVTWAMVDQMNAEHAATNANPSQAVALALLRQNSRAAADVIRQMSDHELDNAAPVSLNWDAPLTAQYFIEEHPISHPYLHAASIRAALGK